MKLLIILLLAGTNVIGQNNFGNLRTNQYQDLMSRYELQQSLKDSLHFVSIRLVSKNKFTYLIPLPKKAAYFRMKGVPKLGGKPYYTDAQLVVLDTTNNVNILLAARSSTTLSWNTTDEINVDHFLIEKTSDGVNYSTTTTKQSKGDSKYSYRYSKTVKKYSYRVTPVYEDGDTGQSVEFK